MREMIRDLKEDLKRVPIAFIPALIPGVLLLFPSLYILSILSIASLGGLVITCIILSGVGTGIMLGIMLVVAVGAEVIEAVKIIIRGKDYC
jgi:hypothetical protein